MEIERQVRHFLQDLETANEKYQPANGMADALAFDYLAEEEARFLKTATKARKEGKQERVKMLLAQIQGKGAAVGA